MIASSLERTGIFISYSHKDQKWLEELQVHLKPLIREQDIDIWDDTRLKVGVRWREEIRGAIQRAKAAVLLISPNFMASDFIAQSELPSSW
jgi:internalin A